MIITKKIRKTNCFLLIMLVLSCNSVKKVPQNNNLKEECYLANDIPSSLSEDLNADMKIIVEEFQKSNYEFQVLHLEIVQAYDYKEKYSLIYFEEDNIYIRDASGKRHIKTLKTDGIKDKLKKTRKNSFVLSCKNNSSSKSTNIFYFKEKNNSSFTYNFTGKELNQIDEDLLRNEIEFVKILISNSN